MENPINSRAILVFHQSPLKEALRKKFLRRCSWSLVSRLFHANLEHTLDIALSYLAADVLLFTDGAVEWKGQDLLPSHPQIGRSLGERILNASEKARSLGYKEIIVVGTDSPGLDSSHLKSAFEALATSNVVVGPSTDGGIFLLGFHTHQIVQMKSVLLSVPWYSKGVYLNILSGLDDFRLSCTTLNSLADIDRWQDLFAIKFSRSWLRLSRSILNELIKTIVQSSKLRQDRQVLLALRICFALFCFLPAPPFSS